MRLIKLRIGFESFLRELVRLAVVFVGEQLRHAQQRARMLRIDRQRFVVEVPGFLGIEALVEELAPLVAIFGVLRIRGHQRFESVVRAFIIVGVPQGQRAIQRLRGRRAKEKT